MGCEIKTSIAKDLLAIQQEAGFLLALQGERALVSCEASSDFYGTLYRVGEHFLLFRDLRYFDGSSAEDAVKRLKGDSGYNIGPFTTPLNAAIYNKRQINGIYPLSKKEAEFLDKIRARERLLSLED